MIAQMSNLLKLKKKNKRMMKMRKTIMLLMLMNPWPMYHRVVMNNILRVLKKGK